MRSVTTSLKFLVLFVLLVGSALSIQAVHAEPIPFYLPLSEEQFPQISQQLESALANAGLSKFRVTTTDYWHPYQQGLRKGRTGVYFAAPHFSAWAISQHKFAAILRLHSELQYVIVARRQDSQIFEVNDLAGKTVCTQKAPNLDFLLSRSALKRAVILARTKSVKSVPLAMRSDDQSCQAFSVSRHIFERFAKTDPFRFIRLQQSEASKNYAFVADRQTTLRHGIALKNFLRTTQAKTILAPMYQLYTSTPSLITAKTSDYSKEDYAPLLDYWR